MNDLDISVYLPILSLGLWVGVFMVVVSKCLNHVIEVFIRIIKSA